MRPRRQIAGRWTSGTGLTLGQLSEIVGVAAALLGELGGVSESLLKLGGVDAALDGASDACSGRLQHRCHGRRKRPVSCHLVNCLSCTLLAGTTHLNDAVKLFMMSGWTVRGRRDERCLDWGVRRDDQETW